MKPAQVDFTMQRGTYGTKGAIVLQALEADGITPMPMTGVSVALQTTNLSPPISHSTADGSITVDAQSNITWQPTSDEIDSIPAGRWTRYFIEMTFPDGSGLRFMEGYFIGRGL